MAAAEAALFLVTNLLRVGAILRALFLSLFLCYTHTLSGFFSLQPLARARETQPTTHATPVSSLGSRTTARARCTRETGLDSTLSLSLSLSCYSITLSLPLFLYSLLRCAKMIARDALAYILNSPEVGMDV